MKSRVELSTKQQELETTLAQAEQRQDELKQTLAQFKQDKQAEEKIRNTAKEALRLMRLEVAPYDVIPPQKKIPIQNKQREIADCNARIQGLAKQIDGLVIQAEEVETEINALTGQIHRLDDQITALKSLRPILPAKVGAVPELLAPRSLPNKCCGCNEVVLKVSDMWAFGVVALETLTGYNPFDRAECRKTWQCIINYAQINWGRKLLRPSVYRNKEIATRVVERKLPRELVWIIDHCLMIAPERRPAVQEVLIRLERLIE